ncbi:Ig-like domain-containing protein [Marinovum algicola]|uniref:Ig-like domain-containing protein n=1 Tax=Marinovum algicola TaxID=42444 RepID=UPI003B529407
MTTDSYPGMANYLVAGTGPYAIQHAYDENALAPFVVIGGASVALAEADFSVSPASGASGNLTLTAGAAATYAGGRIYLQRLTPDEQGYASNGTSRDAALADQLDRTMRVAQDAHARLARASLVADAAPPGPLVATAAERGNLLRAWSEDGTKEVLGPSVTAFNTATDAAIAAAASAAAAAKAAAEGGGLSFADRAAAMLADIPVVALVMRITAYDSTVDPHAGGATYKRSSAGEVAGFPARAWFQSGDGAYWLLHETYPLISMFGGYAHADMSELTHDGAIDSTEAIVHARQYARALDRTLFVDGYFKHLGGWQPATGERIVGFGRHHCGIQTWCASDETGPQGINDFVTMKSWESQVYLYEPKPAGGGTGLLGNALVIGNFSDGTIPEPVGFYIDDMLLTRKDNEAGRTSYNGIALQISGGANQGHVGFIEIATRHSEAVMCHWTGNNAVTHGPHTASVHPRYFNIEKLMITGDIPHVSTFSSVGSLHVGSIIADRARKLLTLLPGDDADENNVGDPGVGALLRIEQLVCNNLDTDADDNADDTAVSGASVATSKFQTEEGQPKKQQLRMAVSIGELTVHTDNAYKTPAGETKYNMIARDGTGEAVVATAVTQPASGTATLNADGTIDYAPDGGFTGTEDIDFDHAGGSGTISVRVGPILRYGIDLFEYFGAFEVEHARVTGFDYAFRCRRSQGDIRVHFDHTDGKILASGANTRVTGHVDRGDPSGYLKDSADITASYCVRGEADGWAAPQAASDITRGDTVITVPGGIPEDTWRGGVIEVTGTTAAGVETLAFVLDRFTESGLTVLDLGFEMPHDMSGVTVQSRGHCDLSLDFSRCAGARSGVMVEGGTAKIRGASGGRFGVYLIGGDSFADIEITAPVSGLSREINEAYTLYDVFGEDGPSCRVSGQVGAGRVSGVGPYYSFGATGTPNMQVHLDGARVADRSKVVAPGDQVDFSLGGVVADDGAPFQLIDAYGARQGASDSDNDAAFAAMAAAHTGVMIDLRGAEWPVSAVPLAVARNGWWKHSDFDSGLAALLPARDTFAASEMVIDGGEVALSWPQGTVWAFNGLAYFGYMAAAGHSPGDNDWTIVTYWPRAEKAVRIESATDFGNGANEVEVFASAGVPPSTDGGAYDGPVQYAIAGIDTNADGASEEMKFYSRGLAHYHEDTISGGLDQAESAWAEVTFSAASFDAALRAQADSDFTVTTSGVPTLCHGMSPNGASAGASGAVFVPFHGLTGLGTGPFLTIVQGTPKSGTASIGYTASIGGLTEGVEPSVAWFLSGASSKVGGFVRSQGSGYPIRFWAADGVDAPAVTAAATQDCPWGNDFGTASPVNCAMRPRRAGARSGYIPTSETLDGTESDEMWFVFTGTRVRDGAPGDVWLYLASVTKGAGLFEDIWTRCKVRAIKRLYFANSNVVDTSNQVGVPDLTFVDSNTLIVTFSTERPAIEADFDECALVVMEVHLNDEYGDAPVLWDDGRDRSVHVISAPERVAY